MIEVARCARRYCGTRLTERHDRAIGRLVLVCEPCARNARGLCRDCPAPKPYRALRCPVCAAARTRARDRADAQREYADPVLRAAKLAARRRRDSKPEVRAKRAKETAAWRASQPKHPVTELDRVYKRAWSNHRYATDSAYREKIKTQTRERARKKRATVLAAREASGRYAMVPRRYRKGDRMGTSLYCTRIPTTEITSTVRVSSGAAEVSAISRTTYGRDPLIGGANV